VTQTASETVSASWQTLMDALDGIPEERMTERGAAGDWSVKDLLGHIAFWESRAVAHLNRQVSNEPQPDDDGDGDVDFEAINVEQHALRENQPLGDARAEMEQTHEQLVALLTRIPDVSPEEIKGNTFGHYAEHTQDILAWRERAGI